MAWPKGRITYVGKARLGSLQVHFKHTAVGSHVKSVSNPDINLTAESSSI